MTKALAWVSGCALFLWAWAGNWPFLMASETAQATGGYTIITRDDGKKQWGLNAKPLYYWAKHQKPGDRKGDGFNNIWSVARE